MALRCLRDFSLDQSLDSRDSWALLDFCKAAQALQVDVRLAHADAHLSIVPRPVSLSELIPHVFTTSNAASDDAVDSANVVELAPTPTPPPESATSRVVADTVAVPKERESQPVSATRSMRSAMQDLLKDEASNWDDLETPVPQASVKPPAPEQPPAPRKPEARVAPTSPSRKQPWEPLLDPQPTPVFEASSAARAEKLIRELQNTDGTCGWEENRAAFFRKLLAASATRPNPCQS